MRRVCKLSFATAAHASLVHTGARREEEVTTEFAADQEDTPAPEYSRRAPTEEDKLARDIALLGKQQAFTKRRSKLNISAGEMNGVSFWNETMGTNVPKQRPPRVPPPNIELPQVSVDPEEEKKVQEEITFVPKSSPSFVVPTNEELLPLSEISFTLEEIEQALFRTNMEDPVGNEIDAPGEGDKVETISAPQVETTPVKESMPEYEMRSAFPAKSVLDDFEDQPPVSEHVEEVEPTVETSTHTATPSPTVPGEKPVADAPRAYVNYGTDRLPCVFDHRSRKGAPPTGRRTRKSSDAPLFQTHFDSQSGRFSVVATEVIGEEDDCIVELHRCLNQFDAIRSKTRGQPLSISFQMKNNAGGNWFLSTNSVNKLCGSALENSEFVLQKESLLSRVVSLEAENVRVTAVLPESMSVTGFAAELLLCCSSIQLEPSSGVEGRLCLPFQYNSACPSPSVVRRMWRKWSSFADSERQTILSQMGLQDVSEESGVGLLSLFRGLDGMSLHSLVQQSLIGESNHQKDSFMGSNLLEKVGRWFRFSSPTTPAVRLSEHDVLLGKYFFDCIHRHRVETSLMKVLQSAESCHVRSSYADAKTLEDVSHWGKLDMFHLTQDNAANSRLIEEDIPRAIEKGKRAIIVLPAVLADDLKVQAIASVQTTVGEDDYLFVFLGRPDAFTESLATVSLAVTISPVDFPRGTGNAAQSVPPPSQHWSRLVEVSFGGIHSTFPKENHSAVQRFLRFQAVSLSIVQELGNSFVLTRNGLVGAGLLSVLCAFLSVHCRDLKHLRRAEEDIQRSLRFTSPVVDLLTPTSTATVFRAFKRLKPLTLSSDHEFGYLDERDFLQVAQGSIPALTTTLDCPPPSKEARQLLCFLLDYSLSALLEEYVLSVEDMNILSIAVLRLHPASGGIFGLAQQSFGGVESVFFDMCELCEENENVHFSSLPFVRYLKERNINFDGISQEVLHRARQTLTRH